MPTTAVMLSTEVLFDKQDVYGGAAMDEDYLYWMGATGLRRLKKW